MKTYFKYILLVCIAFNSACSLDKKPYDAITSDELDNLEGSLGSVTLGNYSRLKGWVENWHRVTEYPGTNVALSGTTTDNLFYSYNYNRLVTNSRVNNVWEQSYKIIVGTNIVIEKLQDSTNPEDQQLLAENLYIRSMLYFYLTNIFGRPYNQGLDNLAVPLKLSSDPMDNPPRATVGDVYTQIENDLLKAESLFTQSKENIYASREAVQALLARIYLYEGKNQDAITYANKVLSSGRFSLLGTSQLANYTTITPESNSETIFAIRFVKDTDYPDNGWYTVGSLYATIDGAGWGEMYASRPYLELVRKYPSDQRNKFIAPKTTGSTNLWALYVTDNYTYAHKVVTKVGDDYQYSEDGTTKSLIKRSNNIGSYDYWINVAGKEKKVLIDSEMEMRNGYPKYYILKCSGQEGQGHLWSPVISRLAEIYLIRAEANAKLGNNQAALDDVNIIRTRAGIPAAGLYNLTNLDGKSVFDIVMEERQLELAWEGHNKFDTFRNGLVLNRQYPGTHLSGASPKSTVAPTSNDIIEYIPESQITASGGILVQNP